MKFLIMNYYSISLFLGGFIALLSGFVVYINDRKKFENLTWLMLNISSAVWSFGYFLMITATSHATALKSNLVLHWGAIWIPIFYFLFILSITKTYDKNKNILNLIVPLAVIFSVINPKTAFISDVIPKFIFNFAPEAGPGYAYFAVYFFGISILAALILYRKASTESDKRESTKLWNILFSSIAGFVGGGSVFLLTYNVIPPYPIILFSIYPIIIAYAIIRHGLFSVKVVTAELFVFLLWIIILVRALIAEDLTERLVNVVLLISVIILGIFLIRSIFQEVRTRERIEKLAKDLEKANERLKILDQQKSEFVSIASHQLRSPLTAIKGYSSMLLEGSFGKVPAKAAGAIERVLESSQHLVALVEDLLNISRIEQGRMIYTMKTVDLRQMAEDIIGALRPNAQKNKLKLSFTAEPDESFIVTVDEEKVRQVILNLIDNAIKYTPKGFVKVELVKDDVTENITLSVSDSGVGVSPQVKERLFEKFSRGDEKSSAMHVNGTGLGLYVAKEIMKAHKGDIWVESPGEGKGSKFYVMFMPSDVVEHRAKVADFAEAL